MPARPQCRPSASNPTEPVFAGAGLEMKAQIKDPAIVWQQLEEAMVTFLRVELETGLVFARAATTIDDVPDLLHNRRLARKSFDTFQILAGKLGTQNPVLHALDGKRMALHNALKKLGEPGLPEA
jgi:hypothetical protein